MVADSHKLGRAGFARICEVTEVAAVLTDDGADPEVLDVLRGQGLQVLLT